MSPCRRGPKFRQLDSGYHPFTIGEMGGNVSNSLHQVLYTPEIRKSGITLFCETVGESDKIIYTRVSDVGVRRKKTVTKQLGLVTLG